MSVHAMTMTLQVAVLLLVAATAAPALAHVLERPGKGRLSESDYRTVQTIYWPGFTVVGVLEPVSVLLVALCATAGPPGAPLVLRGVAAAGLLVAHAIFWVRVRPVNLAWGRDARGGASGSAWARCRRRWESGHTARAVLQCGSLALLASAVAST